MRIIYKYDFKMHDFFENQKIIARKDCNICPGCNQEALFYELDNGSSKKFFNRGFLFTRRRYTQYIYNCRKCGSIWATEPFLYECAVNEKLYNRGKIEKYSLKENE